MMYKKNPTTGKIQEFKNQNQIGSAFQNWKNATQQEIDTHNLHKAKEGKLAEANNGYSLAKASINLTMQIGKDKYLPPQEYGIDKLLELAQEKINIIKNATENELIINSIAFTDKNEFIFRINEHKLNLSQKALSKLYIAINETRELLYNQLYNFQSAINKATTLKELDNIKIEYNKKEEYDLTEFLKLT